MGAGWGQGDELAIVVVVSAAGAIKKLAAAAAGVYARWQRRYPMRHLLALLALGLAPALAAAQPPRPNLVILLTDDQRADCLGCQKHPLLKTPNIDALAEKGVLFD